MNSTGQRKPTTAAANGPLWGAKARDWAELQEVRFRPMYEAVFDRTGLGAGTRYLDVGCGAGLAALLAAERDASVCGLDAAHGLLEVARERVPRGDLRHGDLESLPFADASFDLVTGFNSFQYAGNPVVALTEAARVVRPDGQVVIATWGAPEGMEAAAIVRSMGPLLPPPPPGAPGPFALSDETALRAFAEAAGLRPQQVFDVPLDFVFADHAAAIRGLSASGIAVRAAAHSGDEAVAHAHEQAIAPYLQDDGSYRLAASFRCLVARR
ncbi:MAG: class I SAM-dependent methyltransferase [Burkholderiaceae bacterium]